MKMKEEMVMEAMRGRRREYGGERENMEEEENEKMEEGEG